MDFIVSNLDRCINTLSLTLNSLVILSFQKFRILSKYYRMCFIEKVMHVFTGEVHYTLNWSRFIFRKIPHKKKFWFLKFKKINADDPFVIKICG